MLVNISLKVRSTINMTTTFSSCTREILGLDVRRECPKTRNFLLQLQEEVLNQISPSNVLYGGAKLSS